MSVRGALLMVALMAVVSARAGAQEEIFQNGNRLYQEGRYAEAVEAWQRVREAGFTSAAIHFNLGNAYFKLGRLGPAILEYERAGRIAPGDEDVAANLRLARSVTADDIEPLPRFWLLAAWDWWVDLLPLGALGWATAGSWLLAGGGLVLLILARGPGSRRLGAVALTTAAGTTLLLGLNLAVRELGLGRPEEAVVMAVEVGVKSAPTEDPNLTIFNIHEGTVVQVERHSDAWAEIKLEDGRVGWVPASVFEAI